MNIGVNCFGLRKLFFEDFDGTLDKLLLSGVTSLEATIDFPSDPEAMPDFPIDGNFNSEYLKAAIWPYEKAAEKIEYVRSKGLKVDCVHMMSFMKSPEGFKLLLPKAKELAVKCSIKYFVFSPMRSAEELIEFVPVLNEVCNELSEAGAKLIVHNHEYECQTINGRTGLEIILEKCPALGVELDVGWAKFAGADSVKLMDDIKDNLELIHLKDIKADASEETRDSCFTAIGEGSIPLKDIIDKALELGFGDDEIVIDQDDSDDMLRDIRIGVKNINNCVG